MTDEELKEKTANIMGWSTNGGMHFEYFNKGKTKFQIKVKDWNPLENIEHFFIIIDKFCEPKSQGNSGYDWTLQKIVIWNKPKKNVYSTFMVLDIGTFEETVLRVAAPILKKLMPLVIKKICEVK